jgi:hypothetical protein
VASIPAGFYSGEICAEGGGINNWGNARIQNSTIADNVADITGFADGTFAVGGGIYSGSNPAGAILSVYDSTIARNAAHNDSIADSDEGGGIFSPANAVVHNTVVAGNVALTGPDVFANLASSGYNLFGNSSGGTGYAPTDLLDVNPLLGSLQDNGGPTQTMALSPGSPAIDSGDNTNAPDWDQRGPGYPRVVNGTIDRGAFEVQNTSGPTGGRSILATAPRPVAATLVTRLPALAEVLYRPASATIPAPGAAPGAVGIRAAPVFHAGHRSAAMLKPDADPQAMGW